MRRLPVLCLTLATLLPATAGAQATLNKCLDAGGQVTYSNLPCPKSRVTQKIEVDPAPPPPAKPVAAKQPPPAKPAPARTAPKAAPSEPPVKLELETRRTPGAPPSRASAKQCDSLTNKLGTVLDKMDRARRQGYTQEQMARWNDEVRELERKKQLAGCF